MFNKRCSYSINDFYMFNKWCSLSANNFYMLNKLLLYSANDFYNQREIYIFSNLKFVFSNMIFIFNNFRFAFNEMNIKQKSLTFSNPNLDVTKYISKSIWQNQRSGLLVVYPVYKYFLAFFELSLHITEFMFNGKVSCFFLLSF